ncbi:MAG: hypothetical protein KUG77_09630 [Nannocystaceae bacterium]|nr:hypothetical protein [Nannocystaceae bacterium]
MRLLFGTGCIALCMVACGDGAPGGGMGVSSSDADPTSSGAPGSSSTTTSAPSAESSSTTTGAASSEDTGADTSSSSETGSTGGGPQEFHAGFDITDISPNDGHLLLNVYMGAYGPPFVRGPAESVHDSVYIRSFAISFGGVGFVAAVADLPGFGNDFTADIVARVAENTGLPPEHIMVGATHTHSAPDFMGLWGGGPSEYRNPVIDEIVGSLSRAWLLRVPATLEVASTTGPNNNRRDWDFTDDSITLLMARDEGGDLMGSVGVFAAHPTVLGQSNRAISRDWCAGYIDTMEGHSGAPAVLFNGILGDASVATPPGDFADGFEASFAYGALIADIAYEASGSPDSISPGIVVDDTTWTMPVENVLFQLAAAIDLLDYSFSDSGDGQSVAATSTYVRLGEQLQFVSFPGEPLTRTGLEIKNMMSTPHQAILGNTGPAFGYFILGDEWMTGRNDDYEETVSLHETAGDLAVEAIMDMVDSDRF